MNSEPFKSMQRTMDSAYKPLRKITDFQNKLQSFTNAGNQINNYVKSITNISQQLRIESSFDSTLATIRKCTYPALKLGEDFTRIHDNIQSIANINSMAIPYNFSQNNFRSVLNDYGIKDLMDTINRNIPYLDKDLGVNSAYNSISNSFQNYIFNSFNSYDFEEETDSKQLKEKFNFVKNIDNEDSQSYLDEFQKYIGSPNKKLTQQQCINANKIIINIYNGEVQTENVKISSNQIWSFLLEVIIRSAEFFLEQQIHIAWINVIIIIVVTFLEYKFIND